ncbi:MAG: hypothetical protein ACOYEP_10035 [Limnochordia bacterium]|jgi:hypothetical protein
MADVRIIEIDSVPNRGRCADRLCAKCEAQVAPVRTLRPRRFRLRRRQALVFGGLAAAIVSAAHSPGHNAWVLSYMPPGVTVQRSSESAVERFLDPHAAETWDFCVCSACRRLLQERGWEEAEFEISPAHDLAFHGLGWLTVRRATVVFRVIVPAGVHVSRRPRLVAGK